MLVQAIQGNGHHLRITKFAEDSLEVLIITRVHTESDWQNETEMKKPQVSLRDFKVLKKANRSFTRIYPEDRAHWKCDREGRAWLAVRYH